MWPEPEQLQGARSALEYTLRDGQVIAARALDLEGPVPAWTKPTSADVDELWLYACPLDALGLPPGPFTLGSADAPEAGRRLRAVGGGAWTLSGEAAPRPWPDEARVPNPCWVFDSPVSIELDRVDQDASTPTFLVPFGRQRWLLGGRGVPLHLLEVSGPGRLPSATPIGEPRQLLTGWGDGGETAYALTSTGTLLAIAARGPDDLRITPLASLTATQAGCRVLSKPELVVTDPWAMEGVTLADGGVELVASSHCGIIVRYRSAMGRWTLLRGSTPVESLGTLEEGSAVISVGSGEWLVTDPNYGVVARVRRQEVVPEFIGDGTIRSISLGLGLGGEVIVGTSDGQLLQRETGTYTPLGAASPAGVLSFAPLGSGWVVAADVPNGGGQLQLHPAVRRCEGVEHRPQFSGVEQAYRLVRVGTALVALVWETEDRGRIKIFQPREPPSAGCLAPL